MKLLIKSNGSGPLAAHIPDENGKQLCKVSIKLDTWEIRERSPEKVIVCWHCKRIYARRIEESHSGEGPHPVQ